MPSRREIENYRRSQRALTEAAEREMRALLAMLSPDPVVARRELLEIFPALVQAYGEAGLAVTMEWLEQVSPSEMLRMAPGAVVSTDQAAATAEWAARALTEGDRVKMASLLAGAMQRYTLQPGRETIRHTAARSGARYARIPSGKDPCAFCVMLASRGAVYESEHTASRDDSGDKYHDYCWCVPTLLYPDEPMPEGYDPEALYGLYMTGRSAVGEKWPSTTDILSRMREIHGMR